jgi:hypothetical protein
MRNERRQAFILCASITTILLLRDVTAKPNVNIFVAFTEFGEVTNCMSIGSTASSPHGFKIMSSLYEGQLALPQWLALPRCHEMAIMLPRRPAVKFVYACNCLQMADF